MRTVEKSLELHKRAIEIIPGGAQTLSKMYGRYVQGVAPAFIMRGFGSHVWDVDGNMYIDWTGALGPVILGYGHIYGRVENLLQSYSTGGIISLPLPHKYEVELAEKLIDIIPCAEMVRFAKNGSDATSFAVRLAKAVTGRFGIVCSGFHGWHDWYASTLPKPRSNGILKSEQNQDWVKKVDYGDLETLEEYLQKLPACFILEPMSRQCPHLASRTYLLKVQELCQKYGVILIFDEIILGFRYAMAGGQEMYGVIPDLATYSKAMGNGFPIAALVGNKELMKEIPNLQLSGTFFGEVLSIAAALDTIDFMEENNVIEDLWFKAKRFNSVIRKILKEKEFMKKAGINGQSYVENDIVRLNGFGPWTTFAWDKDYFDAQCFFLQEIVKRGILYDRNHFMMYTHSDEDLNKTLEVYDEVFGLVRKYIGDGTIKERLEGKIDSSLFPK